MALNAGEGTLGGREESAVARGGDKGDALIRRELFLLSSCQERHQQLQGNLGSRVGEHCVRAAECTDALLKESEDGNGDHLGADRSFNIEGTAIGCRGVAGETRLSRKRIGILRYHRSC